MVKVGLKGSVAVLSSGGERYERLRSGSSLGVLWAMGFDRRKAQGKLNLGKSPKP